MQDSLNSQDAELVLAVRAGDSEAYGQLIERHGPRIHALCYRISGRAAVAPELAHDSFVEAYLKLEQLREPALFGAWLRRIALNLCRMWLRRRPLELSFDEDSNAIAPVADEPEPEELANLAAGFTRLRPQHRVILALRYMEGLAYEEIATFLDVPIGTVMSRLHRARHALRTELLAEQQAEGEEPELMTTEQLKRDIEHEIAVLLDAFGAGKGPAERLRVLLRNAPERFAELLQTVERHNLERLAVLLPRLGGRSIELTVLLALSDDPGVAVRARSVLKAMLTRSQVSTRGGFADMPTREAYVLVDQVLKTSAASSLDKATPPTSAHAAQLLLELLDHAPPGPVATLLLHALLCQPAEAFALLRERYEAASEAPAAHVLYGLCRFGAAFCELVLSELRAAPSERDPVVLAAAEAISLCFKLPRRPGNAGLEDLRGAHRHAPLTAADLGPDRLKQLTGLIVRRCDDPRASIQEVAVRVLANLGAREHTATLRALLQSPRIGTRCQALYALAELGVVEAADEFIRAAESSHVAEQCAALSAIARLKLHEALEVLRRLVEHDERSVREAAIEALGQLASPAAEALLHDLLQTDDQELARLAAEVIFSAEPSQPVWSGSALTRARLARLRGDAQPFCSDSVGATIRFATRELRRYEEQELTRAIAQVNTDYSAARRHLIEQGLMTRTDGNYEFTALGTTIWRVEQRILRALSVRLSQGQT
jgi:RNA polymerase sigma-70 factor (ECF subfamily)